MVCTVNGAFEGGTPSLAVLAPDQKGLAAAIAALEKYAPAPAAKSVDKPVQFAAAVIRVPGSASG